MGLKSYVVGLLVLALGVAGAVFLGAVGCDGQLNLPDGPSSDGPTRTPGPRPSPGPSPTPTPEPTANPSPTPSPSPTLPPGPTPNPSQSCASHGECDDDLFCTGEELCDFNANSCLPSSGDPCVLLFEYCDEDADACVPLSEGCQSDDDCEADEYCATDTGLCQPVVALNCGPGAGNCFVANSTPGCESQSCCDAVCQFDVACCLLAWDEDCANMAYSFCPQNP